MKGVGTIYDAWEPEVRAHKIVKCPGLAKTTCMCGADMDNHPYDNHSPVSMWDYYECEEEEPDR
jgi:hypothetical protein